ncbi:MAG TPA: sulfotransferase [Verrucomicrobiae bacterium]|nr:sulfotransferase [Verrucomicrobiae bacterium]
MNRRQRHLAESPARHQAVIRWRGGSYTIGDACVLALQEQSLGNLQAAADIYNLVLARVPDCAEVHNNRGAVLQQMKRYDDALVSYDRAIKLKPDYANAHYNRGSALKQMKRYEDALASYDRAIALKPDHVEAHNNRGVNLQGMRRYDDALASYDKVIAVKPDHAEAYCNRGTALMNKGDMPEAEKMYLRALELKPDFPDALYNLAQIRKYQNADNAEAKHIRHLLERPGISADGRELLYFSLGKIYDDCGRYDEAFECFRQANQIRNTQVAYDSGAIVRMTDGLIDVFSKDFLARPFAHASDSQSPLFIVGMPRSGTTLLANILSNHRAIATAGELPTIADLSEHLLELTEGRVPYPQGARQITAAAATRLINDYERRLRRDLGPEVPHVIDKNPLNFRHLGFIAMLFPKARIIHCTRHPLDTALSNYFQRFPLYLDYSFDLRNIGHFYREYARLMEHWRKIPTLRLMEINYEDMVLNTEQTARKTLQFLGLEWDERCLAPHTNRCAVETSQWQVRQPIYRHALERWRHYEKHLAPLKEALQFNGQMPVGQPDDAFSAASAGGMKLRDFPPNKTNFAADNCTRAFLSRNDAVGRLPK